MSHTYQGKRANIFYNGLFDRRDYIEIIDKETGDEVKIDVDDILNFLEEEYYPHNKSNKVEFKYMEIGFDFLKDKDYQILDIKKLNSLGKEGWELMSIVNGQCIFKNRV
jgi:hypothetical protein